MEGQYNDRREAESMRKIDVDIKRTNSKFEPIKRGASIDDSGGKNFKYSQER